METPVQQKNNSLMAYACILGAAFLWGIIGIWNRRLMDSGVSPTSIVVIRNIGSMLMLSAIFAVKDRSMFRVKREHLKYFFGTGVVSVVLFTLCYFSCQKVCSLAVASILLYTAPSFVVILSAILWMEPVTKKKVAALALTLVGCALVCGVFAGELAVTVTGILFGLGAGFFYALYSIFSRYALRHYSAIQCTLWMFIFAGMASVFLIRPTELSVLLNFEEGLTALILVVLSTGTPFLLYTTGLSYVESGKASIIASFEPVVAALAGVLVFGEPMGASMIAGILCILAGVCILR
jgi:drug/metabolite transporter (DMT)-like permease